MDDQKPLLENLGKFKMGKGCIYVKKLADINLTTLEKMCKSSIAYISSTTSVPAMSKCFL